MTSTSGFPLHVKLWIMQVDASLEKRRDDKINLARSSNRHDYTLTKSVQDDMEELEETISLLKGQLLDRDEILVRKERRILELEDEVKRLKRAIERTKREGGDGVTGVNSSSGQAKNSANGELSRKATDSGSKSVTTGVTGGATHRTKSEPSTSTHVTKPDTKPMAPPVSASKVATSSKEVASRAATSSKSVTPYERKDPLMEFDDIMGMDDDEAHLDELLNLGRPTTPPPPPPADSTERAKSAPQVLGTPEKTRQKNIEIMEQVRQERHQKRREEEERKEYERQNLVIKPVDVRIKPEPDRGSYARSVMENNSNTNNKKKKPQIEAKEQERSKKLSDSAARFAKKRMDAENDKSLLGKFFSGGRQDREKSVLAREGQTEEDPFLAANDPFADEEDQYNLKDHHITLMGTAEDPVALRREADLQKKDLDETSLFFLRERFLSVAEIKLMTEDMKLYSVSECLTAARGGTEIDEPSFAVCGVVASTQVKMYNYGGHTKKAIQIRMGDLASMKEEWTVSLSCNADAVDLCLHWRPGSVVVVVNPGLKRYKITDKDTKTQQEETGLIISSGNNNLAFEIGMTADVGRCEATTRSGERCKRYIYKRKLDMCIQHAEIRERERKKKERELMGKTGTGSSRLKTIDGSAAPPTSTRPEFNSAPSLVKGTKVTSFKPHGHQLQSKSFKRPSDQEVIRQKRENERVTEDLLKSNPRIAQDVFGKHDESRAPLPKHMSQHRHPDDIKVSRYQDDKRMSEYVLEKPDRKKARPEASSSKEGSPVPSSTSTGARDPKSVVAEAARRQVLLARNQSLGDSSDDDDLEITGGP